MSKRELRLTQFFYGGGKGKVDVLGFLGDTKQKKLKLILVQFFIIK